MSSHGGTSFRYSSYLVYLLFLLLRVAAAGDVIEKEYVLGDQVTVECKDWFTNEWKPGPICKESGEALTLQYGVDTFLYCGLEVSEKKVFDGLVTLLADEKTWLCRVPMTRKSSYHVPFTIEMWGVVENDHIHIDNRVNIVFHAVHGKILGASAYPVRDRFQFVKVGTVVAIHGAVKWFHRHGFESLSSAGSLDKEGSDHFGLVATVSGLISALVTLLLAAVLYQRKLKPAVIRKCLKKE